MQEEALFLYSQEMIAKGSKSFAKAAKLFDEETRKTVIMFYAWCRYCDDVIDGQSFGFNHEILSQEEQAKRLEFLIAQTDAVFAGKEVTEPAFLALSYVVNKHDIPKHYITDLLQGFAIDVEHKEFQTIDDVMQYCYYVAGAVGIVMAYIMGVNKTTTLQRACDLGMAFQLTNIARDIIDDADVGRCYLPQEWLDNLKIKNDEILNPENRQLVHAIAVRLIRIAEPYYQSAQIGVGLLPFRASWAIASALMIYRFIGQMILVQGPSAWDSRLHTSSTQKIIMIAQGFFMAVKMKFFSFKNPTRQALWTVSTLSD